MASSMQGLRLKPKYEDLIGVAVSDELRNIKFPNRDAKFLRDGFVLSQLDGEGHREMEKQQEMASKEAYKEHLLKQLARNNSDNISNHSFRTANEGGLREQRINTMLQARASAAIQNSETQFYDISDNTAEGGVQTDQLPNNEGLGVATQTDPLSINEGLGVATQTDQLPHVEDQRIQIEALQQEAYNREAGLLANHEQNLRQVQQNLRSSLDEVSENARRREIHDQTIIDDLVNRINDQSNVIAYHERLQEFEEQRRLQEIEDQEMAIENQTPASSSSSHQAQPTNLFGKSATGLLTIKNKTKAGWAKANKTELQGVLRDFNIPFDNNEPRQILITRMANIFESHGG